VPSERLAALSGAVGVFGGLSGAVGVFGERFLGDSSGFFAALKNRRVALLISFFAARKRGEWHV